MRFFLVLVMICVFAVPLGIYSIAEKHDSIATKPQTIVVYVAPKSLEESVYSFYNTSYHRAQIKCLSLNSYYEARGQGTTGQLAVANVVLNRAEEKDKEPCKVVREKHGHVCQFSWVCEPHKAPEQTEYQNITGIIRAFYVRRMMKKEMTMSIPLKDMTHGATYYHAKRVHPHWSFTKTVAIGDHIFYKEDS